MSASNKKIFAANWKLNKSPEEARKFVINLKNELFKYSDFFNTREIIIFPSAFALEAVASLCAGTQIGFGPQNVWSEKSGAFTGENSADIAKELKSNFALIGHSERREIFKENDLLLNKKTTLVQSLSMTPVFCIGETLAQRQAGETLNICRSQIAAGLESVRTDTKFILAYEPVWAIGTGQVATPQQVAEVHSELHKILISMNFKDFSILYGGSVKPENANELLSIPHVDGFLIGGASLQTDSFLKICLA